MAWKNFLLRTRLAFEEAKAVTQRALKAGVPTAGPEVAQLEDRVLLSASPGPVMIDGETSSANVEPTESAEPITTITDDSASDATTGEQSATAEVSSDVRTTEDALGLLDLLNEYVSSETTDDRRNPSASESDADAADFLGVRHELVLIDNRLPEFEQLIAELQAHPDASRKFQIVVVSETDDGLDALGGTLAEHQDDLDAVHLFSHGTNGLILLGSTTLSQDTIALHTELFASWRTAISEGADLLLYGCGVAATETGQVFVSQLAQLTGMDVAASVDATGHTALGGNWELEYATGRIDTPVAPSSSFREQWMGLLPTYEQFTSYTEDAALRSSVNWGQTFRHNSGAGQYSVNQISLAMYRDGDADAQNITATLCSSWSGSILASATVASGSLSTGYTWVDFNFAPIQLTDNQSYTIRITSSADDGEVFLGYAVNGYANGTLLDKDGASVSGSDLAFKVNFVNTAPGLDNTKGPTLTSQNEDAGAPAGAVGTLVSSLVDFGVPTGQVDNVTDPDLGSVLGIAITAADMTNGTWYYSTDGGTNWLALGAVNTNSARLLAADANTRLYFQPNANFNGTLANAITFRAWDRTSGASGSLADTSSNGGTTAFSSATDTASLTINAVNDAPVLDSTQSPTLSTLNEDAGAPSGAVGTLISSLVDFQTPSGQMDNISDVDASAQLGIAVTAADTTNGSWYYSTNGGSTWNALGSVSTSSARLLAADANTRIYFRPNTNYNGTLADAITFRAWDQTSGSNGGTGNTSTNGGTTAFSAATDTISVTVNAINDAPTRTSGVVNHLTVLENSGLTSLGLGSLTYGPGGGSDESGQTLVYRVIAVPSATLGNVVLADGVTVVTADTNYTLTELQGMQFQTAANVVGGPLAFQWTVQDNGGTANGGVDTRTETLNLTVTNFIVTNTNDSGTGSLRQQIIDSNNVAGVNTITFNLAGTGVHTIRPTSALPTITDAVIIDGYTQPGSSPNTLAVGSNATLLIVLSGSNISSNAYGLNIASGGSTVRGLVINDFTYSGIVLNSADGNVIAGNFIGTNASGTAAIPNGRGTGWDGISIGESGTSSNNVIGGNTPADRNVISGNAGGGIWVSASNGGNTIRGNYIGVNAAGTAAIGNGQYGIILAGTANTVVNNVISGNGSAGYHAIYVPSSAPNTLIQGNLIGVGADGSSPIGNVGNGIRIESSGNSVGGTAAEQGNTIANSTGPGVVVTSGGTGNAILGNSIYSNSGIGIDRFDNGVSANDGTKSSSQSNYGMDFPLFTNASLSGDILSAAGFVGSAAGQTTFAGARIEIYKSDADSTGYGEGRVFLGFLTSDANGNFSGTLDVSGKGLNAGDRITGTATDGSNNTSEFGLSIMVGNAAPTLASCVNLPTIEEDSVSHQGILVSTLIAGQITDTDPFALTGIAVTAVNNSNGSWQYSTNGGSSWSNFGSASANSSRLLASDASTYVRFVPNANWNGTLTNGITFRAWDQTEGAAGGTANTNANGENTAFSTTTASASITVTAVNDAPVASGSATLTAIDEDSTSPAGNTVNALFGGNFSDATDQVVGGSTANTFAGIAISSYTVNASVGQWQYSTNGGVDWTTLSSTTTTTALTLNSADLLRFVPTANYNGSATTLAANLIESGQVITSGATVNLTGATGGITSISSATVTLVHTINPVNDAPVLDSTRTPALTVQNEDSGTPAGAVGTLVSSLVDFASPSGQLDNVTEVDSSPLLGIAITTADTTNGAWYYSTNGGTNWNALGAVANNNARLLAADATTRIYFQPNVNYNGTVASAITFRAWDRTSGGNGALADTTTNGGITAFSTATDTANLTINPVNDAPVLTPYNPTYALTEDGSPYVVSVASVLQNSVTDVDSGALQGIALYAIGGSGGVFEYSLNGGSSWNAVSPVSSTSALLLRATDQLRFVPDTANGGTVTLDFRAWDQTSGTAGSRVDVTTNGGTTAFSAAAEHGTVTVTSVNDAPVLDSTKSPTLAAHNEDAGAPSGTVGTLVSSLVDAASPSGQVDNVTDVDSGSVLGIAITAADTTDGTWWYSTNGGSSWNALGVIANNNARLLTADANTRIYFQPNANYSGTLIAAITFHAWDQTSGTNGSLADTTTNGGTTAFSATTDTASLIVTSANDPPVITSNGGGTTAALSISENSTVVTTVTATDVDLPAQSLSYSIVGGADAARFAINSNTGALTFESGPDRETPTDADADHVYEVTVSVSDGTDSDAQALSITVTDVDEFDTGDVTDANGTDNTVAENAGIGAAAGITAAATDADATNNTITYSLDDDAGGLFAIHATTGAVTVNGALDYETATSHLITVRATSADESSSTERFTVSVTNVNESGVTAISDADGAADYVPENSANSATVGLTAFADDPDTTDTVAYSLDDDANGLFAIDANTGVVTVNGALDYEAATSHAITIRATSSDGSYLTQNYTISVTNVNETPVSVVDDYFLDRGQTLTVGGNGVLENDWDIDGDQLIAVLQSGVAHGLLVLQADGTFTYQPNPTFFGIDQFTYLATDGALTTETVAVTLVVNDSLPQPDTGNDWDTDNKSDDSSTEDSSSDDEQEQDEREESTEGDGTTTDTPDAGPDEAALAELTADVQEIIRRAFGSRALEQELEAVSTNSEHDHDRSATQVTSLATLPRTRATLNSGMIATLRSEGFAYEASHHILVLSTLPLSLESTSMPEEPANQAPGISPESLVLGTSAVVSSALTVGYVTWLLRGGSLLASLLASLPAWASFDPLPVLMSGTKPDEEDEGKDRLVDLVRGEDTSRSVNSAAPTAGLG